VTEPLYVAARGVLLDALDALGEQRQALILAGAQAIYVHTGTTDLAVAEFTTDGDLVIVPDQLKPHPRLSDAMERSQFRSGSQPGRFPSTCSCPKPWRVPPGEPRGSATTVTGPADGFGVWKVPSSITP
jgi:hypothetical protein